MKRAFILLSPLLAFVLGAVAAWLAGSPVSDASATAETFLRSSRQREAETARSRDPVQIAAQFESEMVNYRAPPKAIHDADGMESVFKSDRMTQSFPGGGGGWISYSMEWAEDSPEDMFAWLIHQGGSDFKQRVNSAAILFNTWAVKDREAALAAIFKISDTDIRRQALASSLEILYQTHPDRARELMTQNLELFSSGLGGTPFKAYDTGKTTCDLLLSLPHGEVRTQLLADLLSSLATWSMDGTAAYAISIWNQAPESQRRELVAAGFDSSKENSASFDGLEDIMRDRAETSNDPRVAEMFMQNHGPALAKRDLAGTLDWAHAHLKGKARVEQCAELFESAASQDFDTTLATWQTLPEGILKARAAGAMSKGAPASRKTEAEAVIQSLSAQDQDLAR
jgi:hypothetical protein